MTAAISSDPWIECSRQNPAARLRLFCFPYAGGSALVYRTWHESLPATVEVCAVQLPGRGARLRETPFKRLTPLVEALAQALRPYLDKPFAFFGHSMGALISFELARRLRLDYGLTPLHLFVSGRSAPRFPNHRAPIHALPRAEFIEELTRFNGTPKEVLEHPDLMDLLIPILRADFELCETYVYAAEPSLPSRISAFGGLEDDVSRERLDAWREETSAAFSLQMYRGDHFFIHASQWLLLRSLAQELSHLVSAIAPDDEV